MVTNILDFFFTQYILSQGGMELNPIMKPIVYNFWLTGFIKIILVPLGIYFVWINREYIDKITHIIIKGVTVTYILLMIYYIFGFSLGIFY